MTSKDWPPLPESIQTPRLLLRRFRLGDAEDVYAYARDPEWGRFLDVEQPYEQRHADEFVAERVLAKWRRNPIWAFEKDGRVVGGLSLWVARRNRRAAIGYDLARELWGRGLATEAVSAVIDEAFRRLPIGKVTATASAANVRSTRLLERLGMQREALLRQHWIHRGQALDEARYGLLRAEWEQRAGATPSERDASG